MPKLQNYIKMSIEAKEIQKALRDDFDFRQGYCVKHKCLIEEDIQGSAVCPVYEKKAEDLWEKTELEQDDFYREEGCLYSKNWIGFPTLEELFSLIREIYHSDWAMAMDFGYWIDEEATEILKPVVEKSIKELLLMFVMKRKYGKLWDKKKEKWVKEGKDSE